MISLDDPITSARILAAVDQRVDQVLQRRLPAIAYGVVDAVDPVNHRCSVFLYGQAASTPGFDYVPIGTAPAVGNKVRVVLQPGGDRYVDRVVVGADWMSGEGVFVGSDLRLRAYDANAALGIVNADASAAKNLRARGITLSDNYGDAAPGAGVLQTGDYPNVPSAQLSRGGLELRHATPFIDFSNDNAADNDARIRLTGNDVLAVEGADLDAPNLPRDIAFGSVNVTINNGSPNGSASVVFPFTFAVAPLVVVSVASLPANSSKVLAKLTGITTSGFSVYAVTGDGANMTVAVTVVVSYMAAIKTAAAAAG